MSNCSGTLTSSSRALGVLRVTRGNIRALGGARDPEQTPYAPYQLWLDEVEKAIAALEQDGVPEFEPETAKEQAK